MSALGPEARALIDDAAGVDRSTRGDKERVRARLAVQAGLVAAGAAAAASTASSAAAKGTAVAGASVLGAGGKAATAGATGGLAIVLKVLGAVGLAGVVAVGAVSAHREPSGTMHASATGMGAVTTMTPAIPGAAAVPAAPGSDEKAAAAQAFSAAQAAADAGITAEPAPRPVGATAVTGRGQPLPGVRNDHAVGPAAPVGSPLVAATAVAAPGPGAGSSALATAEGEATLLRSAEAAIAVGDGVAALALLDTHARRYPDGALADQRDAERVVAMCTVGRVPAAREAAQRYLVAHPRSSKADRVRRVCGTP